MQTDGINHDQCRDLWASVLFVNLRTGLGLGLADINDSAGRRHERVMADGWVRSNTADFREVCDLAGVDSEAVRSAYLSGRLSDVMRNTSRWDNRKMVAAE